MFPTAPVAPLPRPEESLAGLWPDRERMRTHLRSILFAAFLSLPAAMILHAEEAPQGWVPEALELPADMDVINEREIGATLRMFSFSTERDADTLLAEWEEALRLGGYTIVQSQDDILDTAIEFSGPGITNAKIVIAPVTDGDRAVIEFDATLQ